MPRQRRLPMPYFACPWRRGRWFTGTSVTRAPSIRSRVGRKRCMPLNTGMRRAYPARKARRVQPTSVIDS